MSEPIVALTIEAFEKLKRDHERLAWEVTRNQEAIRRVGAGVVGLPGSQVFVAKANADIAAGDEGDFKVWDYDFGSNLFDASTQIIKARDWLQTGFTNGDRAVLCKHNQSRRWIAVKKVERLQAYGVLTYTGSLAVNNGTQIPFASLSSGSLISLNSNGLKLDAGAPSGLYLVALQVDAKIDDAETLGDFNDAAFDTDQNTALDTRFKRDWLGSIKFSAFVNSIDTIQQSHLLRRTSSGQSAYSGNPYTSIHCHAIVSYSPASTIKGYVDVPASVTLTIDEARLSAIYLG